MAVTGGGLLTSLGSGWEANAAGFREGRAAFREVQGFDVSRQRVKVAAELDLPEGLPESRLSNREANRADRGSRMLLWAGQECLAGAAWETPRRTAVVLGTTSGGMTVGEDYYRRAIGENPTRKGQADKVVHYQARRQSSLLQQAFGLEGPAFVVANACASGANAVGLAWEMVRSGRVDRAVCGGYDALCQLVFAGFDSLQALSSTMCRPFDAKRDGLALGEGAAVFALEPLEEARRRGARILGEIRGYAAATDVHHLTQPHPEGVAALDTMRRVCETAGLTPLDIQYVNAHGTGTPLNDASEAAAINAWAGADAAGIAVSSTKASVGHLLGAAGAVETAVCLMALEGGWLPPTRSCRTPDSACRFRVVTEPEAAPLENVMSNSFGFGGANASLILGRVS